MAIKTKDELLTEYRTLVGDDLTDEQLAFVENITDTMVDFEEKAKGDGTDWKKKYEENDANWKKKYTDRFFSKDVNDTDPTPDPDKEEPKKLTFDSLFTVKGDKNNA